MRYIVRPAESKVAPESQVESKVPCFGHFCVKAASGSILGCLAGTQVVTQRLT